MQIWTGAIPGQVNAALGAWERLESYAVDIITVQWKLLKNSKLQSLM